MRVCGPNILIKRFKLLVLALQVVYYDLLSKYQTNLKLIFFNIESRSFFKRIKQTLVQTVHGCRAPS